MDRIQKIKYNKELLKNKTRLEKQLTMVNRLIEEEKKTCDNHLPILTPACDIYCLLCGKKLFLKENEDYIDSLNFKTRNYLEDVQNIVLEILMDNPNIEQNDLIKKVNTQTLKQNSNKDKKEKVKRK